MSIRINDLGLLETARSVYVHVSGNDLHRRVRCPIDPPGEAEHDRTPTRWREIDFDYRLSLYTPGCRDPRMVL